MDELDDLASLVRATTAEAYALADTTGRLPERIVVEASFDVDASGGLALNQSRRFPGAVKMKMELAPQAAPPGLRLIADHAARESAKGQNKRTRKRTNHTILYRRQGGCCVGCRHFFQPRNLTIDHVVPRFGGGSDDIANLQLLCEACNQLKGSGTQSALLAELRARGFVNPGVNATPLEEGPGAAESAV
ncbi:MAG: HNH endonuclease signature motif containing protein [Chloroflexi bacterium]|nr:HNH endonuclease signature motif containing protein [Chloroflexota bacterium]